MKKRTAKKLPVFPFGHPMLITIADGSGSGQKIVLSGFILDMSDNFGGPLSSTKRPKKGKKP